MDATISPSDGTAGAVAQPLVFQPEILSRGDLEALCRQTIARFEGDGDLPGLAWDDRQLCESLQSLGRLAVIACAIPDFARWPWYSRGPARLAARCVLFLAKFLVTRQSQFNTASLNVLNNVTLQLAEVQIRHKKSVRGMELRLQQQIIALEARVIALQSELTRLRGARVDA